MPQMAGLTLTWLVVCFIVSLTATAQSTMQLISLQNECFSMTRMTTIRKSYELFTVSSTLCAALCIQKGAMKYTFSGMNHTCTLHGEGLAPASSSGTFVALDTLQDVATHKAAYSSSVHSLTFNPSLAVDTDVTNSMFHSSGGDKLPWWLLDLGATYTIHDIRIITRQDCCFERFHDIEIRVGQNKTEGEFSSYTLFSRYKGPYTLEEGQLSCVRGDGVTGRFIAILKVEALTNYYYPLQIVDVDVFVRE